MELLTQSSTNDNILARIKLAKIAAVNVIHTQLTGADASSLEPREIKALTECAVGIENSLVTGDESEQDKLVSRLLNKYATDDYVEAELCNATA